MLNSFLDLPLTFFTTRRIGVDEQVLQVLSKEELAVILRKEKARNVCCIELPKHLNYADYLIICTPFSHRHLKALVENICKHYKAVKTDNQQFVKVEGKDVSPIFMFLFVRFFVR